MAVAKVERRAVGIRLLLGESLQKVKKQETKTKRHKSLSFARVTPKRKGVSYGSLCMERSFCGCLCSKKAEAARESGRNEVIKIWSRRSTILPQFVGLTFGVYNGRKHIPVSVSEDMIGQKFGEYSPTRTYYGHGADKKAKRK